MPNNYKRDMRAELRSSEVFTMMNMKMDEVMDEVVRVVQVLFLPFIERMKFPKPVEGSPPFLPPLRGRKGTRYVSGSAGRILCAIPTLYSRRCPQSSYVVGK